MSRRVFLIAAVGLLLSLAAYAGTEEVLAQAMYQEKYENNVYRLGDLTQAGREAISSSYMARTYTLLGDPAMELRLPPPEIYLPLFLQDN